METKNQQAFTEAVRKALSPDNGLLHGEELANVIKRENSTEQMVKEYMEIYKELM